MAKKISELAAVTDVQDTDQFVLARSGATDSITGANLKAGVRAAGCAVVRGPFSFAFNTASLNNGVTIYTPTVGDILLDAWIETTSAFDGTTPTADIGTFSGVNYGLFGGTDSPMPLDGTADSAYLGAGLILGRAGKSYSLAMISAFPGFAGGPFSDMARIAPARFTATNPLLLVVSQDGLKGGTAINSTTGAGRVYLVTATPLSL